VKTSEQGIRLIKFFESIHDGDLKKIGLQPKQCPVGIWTVGYGRALKDLNGQWLKGVEGYKRMLEIYPDLETITEDEACEMLEEDLMIYEKRVDSLGLKLFQYQFDALVSFSYNLGFNALKTSTLLRRIKGEKGSIYEAFLMWNKADGKVLNGLVKRRQSEANLFLSGTLKF
jgi:lysozyme